MKIEKDLGIKVGTKKEALYTRVKKDRETQIEHLKEAMEIEQILVDALDAKIKEEHK